MKHKFHVELSGFSILEEIPGTWTTKEYSDLLSIMEYGSTDGMDEDELKEMCLLSLQDFEPEEAAAIVLEYCLGNQLSAGQIQNLSVEMLDEKLWEEHADMALHERLFIVSSIMYSAFPNAFPEPDAVKASFSVSATDDSGRHVLLNSMTESFLIRLLASGMDEDTALNRLFEEQLAGNTFPEAEFIIWITNSESSANDTFRVEVISSGTWLDALRDTKSFSAVAWSDGMKDAS